MNKNVIFICQAAIIAALYVVLTMLIGAFASGPIQIRISEALTVLPCFTPAAIPGLTIGCFLPIFLPDALRLMFFLALLPLCWVHWDLMHCVTAANGWFRSPCYRQYYNRTLCTAVCLSSSRCHTLYDGNSRDRGNIVLLYIGNVFALCTG